MTKYKFSTSTRRAVVYENECEVFYRPQRVKYSRLCTQEYIFKVLVKTNGTHGYSRLG